MAQAPCIVALPPEPRGHTKSPPPPAPSTATSSISAFTSSISWGPSSIDPPATSSFLLFFSFHFFSFFLLFSSFLFSFLLLFFSWADESDDLLLEESSVGGEAG